jgi:hypothetical protein
MSSFKKQCRFLVSTILLVSVLNIFCSCKYLPNPKKYFSKDFNAAGAVTHSRNSFSPVETGTIRLRSNEIWNRRDFSGDKTTALWGLFTYTDY